MFDNGRVGFVIVILTELPNYVLWMIFFYPYPFGGPTPGGGVELASYDEAMAQLGRVSPEQLSSASGGDRTWVPSHHSFLVYPPHYRAYPPE